MGCGAIKVSPDVQEKISRQEQEIDRLKRDLSACQKEHSQKAAEISRMQMQQLSGKAGDGDGGLSTAEVQDFLKICVPEACEAIKTAKKHGVNNTEKISETVGGLRKKAADMLQTVDNYHKQVKEQSERLRSDAEKLQGDYSKLVKELDVSKVLSAELAAATTFEFKVISAKKLRAWIGGPLPKQQEINATLGAGSLQTIKVSLADLAANTDSLKKILVVSHRWVRPGCPDPDGKQQALIKEYLNSHPEIEFVWLDWWCIPQGKRSDQEQDYFEKTLENIYILFLGSPVLMLVDMQYLGRFWTSYESWLSMRAVSEDGFIPAMGSDCRFTIKCLGAAGVMEQSLKDTWGPLDIEQAHSHLSEEDIIVTNRRDKEQQLRVLKQLSVDLPPVLSLLNKTQGSGVTWEANPACANIVRMKGNSAEIIANCGYVTFVASKPCTRWRIRVDGAPKYWFCMGVCKGEPGLNFVTAPYATHLCGAVVSGDAGSGSYQGAPYGPGWASQSGQLGNFKAGDEIAFEYQQNTGKFVITGPRGRVEGATIFPGMPLRPCVCVHQSCIGMVFRLLNATSAWGSLGAPSQSQASLKGLPLNWQANPALGSSVQMNLNRAQIKANVSYVTFVGTRTCRRFRIRVDGAPRYWFCMGVCKGDAGLDYMTAPYAAHLCGAVVGGDNGSGSYLGAPYGPGWASHSGQLGNFCAGDEIICDFEQSTGKLVMTGPRGCVQGITNFAGLPLRPCVCVHANCIGMAFTLTSLE